MVLVERQDLDECLLMPRLTKLCSRAIPHEMLHFYSWCHGWLWMKHAWNQNLNLGNTKLMFPLPVVNDLIHDLMQSGFLWCYRQMHLTFGFRHHGSFWACNLHHTTVYQGKHLMQLSWQAMLAMLHLMLQHHHLMYNTQTCTIRRSQPLLRVPINWLDRPWVGALGLGGQLEDPRLGPISSPSPGLATTTGQPTSEGEYG